MNGKVTKIAKTAGAGYHACKGSKCHHAGGCGKNTTWTANDEERIKKNIKEFGKIEPPTEEILAKINEDNKNVYEELVEVVNKPERSAFHASCGVESDVQVWISKYGPLDTQPEGAKYDEERPNFERTHNGFKVKVVETGDSVDGRRYQRLAGYSLSSVYELCQKAGLFKKKKPAKPCSFFSTPDGCSNGKSCKFRHDSPSVSPSSPSASEIITPGAVGGKESDKEDEDDTTAEVEVDYYVEGQDQATSMDTEIARIRCKMVDTLPELRTRNNALESLEREIEAVYKENKGVTHKQDEAVRRIVSDHDRRLDGYSSDGGGRGIRLRELLAGVGGVGGVGGPIEPREVHIGDAAELLGDDGDGKLFFIHNLILLLFNIVLSYLNVGDSGFAAFLRHIIRTRGEDGARGEDGDVAIEINIGSGDEGNDEGDRTPIVTRDVPPGVGCSSSCGFGHFGHGPCLRCGIEFDRHRGHRCADENRGSWPLRR